MWENVPPTKETIGQEKQSEFSRHLKSLHLHHLKALEEKLRIINCTVNPGTLHDAIDLWASGSPQSDRSSLPWDTIENRMINENKTCLMAFK